MAVVVWERIDKRGGRSFLASAKRENAHTHANENNNSNNVWCRACLLKKGTAGNLLPLTKVSHEQLAQSHTNNRRSKIFVEETIPIIFEPVS